MITGANLTELATALADLDEQMDAYTIGDLSEHMTSREYMAVANVLHAAGYHAKAEKMATTFIHGDNDCIARLFPDTTGTKFHVLYYAEVAEDEPYAGVVIPATDRATVVKQLRLTCIQGEPDSDTAIYGSDRFH